MGKIAVIIGAGPAGLTAAYELLTRSDVKPIVLEKNSEMGGISRTVRYKGNRMDIGGHRFFSKSDRVMNWWLKQMPLEDAILSKSIITYQRKTRAVEVSSGSAAGEPEVSEGSVEAAAVQQDPDAVLLLRPRKSRIYYLRKFFAYPVQLNKDTLSNLGAIRTIRIALSYLRSIVFPIRAVRNLEDFFINRFGRELYSTFFKSYTEKVWGIPCQSISAAWGEQRIKGLSIQKSIAHYLRKTLRRGSEGVLQKETETSLIEQFLYPKFGPGQMWEEVARKVEALGGSILRNVEVTGLETEGKQILAVCAVDATGQKQRFASDFVFSTMPVKELVRALDCAVPASVREVSEGLRYRDFITVGLLLNSLKIKDRREPHGQLIADNWIYLQEPEVLAGRLQIFNNWSPHLLDDPSKVWVGVEYFCNETDAIWKLSDAGIAQLAKDELHKIEIIDSSEVIDWHVERVPKTYPAYFGVYERFEEVRNFVDGFQNLFLIGRNGMHKYNNQDHSMLTAMTAVDNIIARRTDKSNIWAVNTEIEYHEGKE